MHILFHIRTILVRVEYNVIVDKLYKLKGTQNIHNSGKGH